MKSELTRDGSPLTKLKDKEFSPLILRRYSMPFLHWVAVISDDDLDSLDHVVTRFWDGNPECHTIQQMRRCCGALQEHVQAAFPRIEGCAVIFSADKMLISSLAGDFMVHEQCRMELYLLLNLSTQV